MAQKTIKSRLKQVENYREIYAQHQHDDNNSIKICAEFHDWHNSASALFSELLSPDDSDLISFIKGCSGNQYVLSHEYDLRQSSYSVLMQKITKSQSFLLEELIETGNTILQGICFIPANGYIRTFNAYRISDERGYETWKNKCLRFLSVYFPKDRVAKDFEEAAKYFADKHNNPRYMNDMLGILDACVLIPANNNETAVPEVPVSPVTVNVNQSQSQNQTQTLNVFLEAIKDELTGKQLKELNAIAVEEKEPEKARSKVINKLRSFGESTLASILANIVTNPAVWNYFS